MADIAIQKFGRIDAWFLLAWQNNISITAKVDPGTGIDISDIEIIDPEVVQFFRHRNIRPATAIGRNVVPTGVGTWRIGSTFIIPQT